MSENSIKKNQCLKELQLNTPDIHPILNYLTNVEGKQDGACFVLPQVINNVIVYNKIIKKTDNIEPESELNFSDNTVNNILTDKSPITNITDMVDTRKTKSSKLNKQQNELINFSFPINENNFLDIIFNITNIKQLINWFIAYDMDDVKTIDLVLNLFWKNYYESINENITEFNELNFLIVKYLYGKVLTHNEIQQLSNKIISKNYGKNIKYLEKIKKYIDELV